MPRLLFSYEDILPKETNTSKWMKRSGGDFNTCITTVARSRHGTDLKALHFFTTRERMREDQGRDRALRFSHAVGQRVHGSLPALGGEEDGGLGHLASTAGVGRQALRHQVLPGHPEVHRVLDVDLPVGGPLWQHAAHRYLWRGTGGQGSQAGGSGAIQKERFYIFRHFVQYFLHLFFPLSNFHSCSVLSAVTTTIAIWEYRSNFILP